MNLVTHIAREDLEGPLIGEDYLSTTPDASSIKQDDLKDDLDRSLVEEAPQYSVTTDNSKDIVSNSTDSSAE